MLTKIKTLKAIKQLPDEFSLDELINQMILLEKIESGLAQSEKGGTIYKDDLTKAVAHWFG